MSTPTPSLPFDRPDPLRPPAVYAELRRRAPVAEVTTPDGRRAWLVTSYDAAVAALTDPRLTMTPPGGGTAGDTTLFQDGEPHTRLRGLVAKAFTPRSVAALRPRVREMADDHVAALAAAGPPADLVAGLAAPLSLQVISVLLGVAIDERERFHALVEAFGAVEHSAGDDREGVAEALRAWNEFTGYAAGLVAAKRRAPGDDLLSALIRVRDTGDERLTDDELVGMVATLVAAGYQTARNAIAVGTVQLVTGGLLAGLADAPGRMEGVVEEVLRRLAGVIAEPFPRWARTGLELAGAPIAAGDLVLVRLEAANHDPACFTDPGRFLPGRFPSGRPSRHPHLTFGRGPHHCLGASLARVELAAAFDALARRLPGLRLRVPPEDLDWVRGETDAGPASVPVTW
ncbi:cytochrome P450 [Actinomadura kijaniata]|uniref:cytochrome P450 n=1 Tax=Actinomadura kijaniata TaxID=46161 RepID=UPI000829ADB4|nr:cytochrome P450 [Actinomadura kijaniata]